MVVTATPTRRAAPLLVLMLPAVQGSTPAATPSSPPNVPPGGCRSGSYCPPESPTGIPCPIGSYNPFVGASDVSACFSCPPNSHGAYEGANSIYGCTCDPGYLADDLLISWTLLADATYTPFDRSLTDALCNPCPRGSFFSNRGAETESSGTGFCYSCSSQPWLFVRQPSPSLGFDLPPLEHAVADAAPARGRVSRHERAAPRLLRHRKVLRAASS